MGEGAAVENGHPRSRAWGSSPPGAADVSSRGDPVTRPLQGHMGLPLPRPPARLRTGPLGIFLLRIRLILGRAVAKETGHQGAVCSLERL